MRCAGRSDSRDSKRVLATGNFSSKERERAGGTNFVHRRCVQVWDTCGRRVEEYMPPGGAAGAGGRPGRQG